MARNYQASSPLSTKEKILLELLYGTVCAISLLPFWLLYLLSDGLCILAYNIIGYRKNIVRKNLRMAFPEKNGAELLSIEKKFYRFFCDYIVETIKLATISKTQMKRRVVFSGLENLMTPLDRGKGVALYLGHYCNWEWVTAIGLYLPEKSHGCQVYHVLESRVMDRLMLRLRSRMGTENISKFEILRKLVLFRQQQKLPVVGLISDQNPDLFNIPVWIEFLHQDTPFLTGSEKMIKHYRMACVYFDVSRVKRGYYHVDIVPLAEDPCSLPDWELTERYATVLEKSIMRQPPYWLWTHNRWKRSHEDYYNADKKN